MKKLKRFLSKLPFILPIICGIVMTYGLILICSFITHAKIEDEPMEEHDWKIILDDTDEAMPAIGGHLQVEYFKGDTVYVSSVE